MRCLGALPPRHDARTLQLASYMGKLPMPPASRSWVPKNVAWGMMGNDSMGDCTIAAAAHAVQTWTGKAHGNIVTIDDSEIRSKYFALTGGPDEGLVVLDVLKDWRTNGISGHRIGAFAATEPLNRFHIETAINLFGGLYVGVNLPMTAQDQKVWAVTYQHPSGPAEPGSWGPHAVWLVAYDQTHLWCVTWGELKKLTWRFFDCYCQESYAALSPDWVNSRMKAPVGFDLPALQADLAMVSG
jgi:hypothetical protein